MPHNLTSESLALILLLASVSFSFLNLFCNFILNKSLESKFEKLIRIISFFESSNDEMYQELNKNQ